jgi:hypothetical protein
MKCNFMQPLLPVALSPKENARPLIVRASTDTSPGGISRATSRRPEDVGGKRRSLDSCMMRWLFFAFAVVMTGCTITRMPAVSCNSDVSPCGFPGIDTALERARESDIPLRVLVVHGIGNHEKPLAEYYSKPIIEGLASRLGLTATDTMHEEQIWRPNGDRAPELAGYLRIQDYKERSDRGRLRLFELTWSTTTNPLKRSYLGFDNTWAITNTRIPLNRSLKSEILNDDLADAVLYLSPTYRREMQYPVEQALCRIITDTPLDGRPCNPPASADFNGEIVVITHSLGSRMIFDAIEAHQYGRWIDRFKNRVTQLYMLANQLPLLDMGEYDGVERKDATATPLTAQDRVSSEKSAAPGHVIEGLRALLAAPLECIGCPTNRSIVAFSDPNDLLSYPLPRAFTDRYQGKFFNVLTNVATFIWAGIVVHPLDAHTNYERDDSVLDMLAQGAQGNSTVELGSE